MRAGAPVINERPYSWKTSAISSGGSVTRLPRRIVSPRVGRRSPATHFSSVVLPQPDGPTTQTRSPSSTTNVTPRRASVAFSSAPYVFARCVSSSISAPARRRPPAAAPGQQPALGQEEDDVQQVADHADQHD